MCRKLPFDFFTLSTASNYQMHIASNDNNAHSMPQIIIAQDTIYREFKDISILLLNYIHDSSDIKTCQTVT